jgi:murein DD-endopeptidase MepM/ murein hydrolase activator NlpD
MASFTIDMSSPLPSGFTGDLGGPRSGGHQGPNWYIEFGMDLGANPGSEVRAAFDAHITRFTPHAPANDTSKVFGAQLFMRHPNDMMGGFYTHITDVPGAIGVDTKVKRGDLLGKVHPGFGSPHLHMALVEIIGGAPQGRYVGVDLFKHFVSIANTSTVSHITFNQNGTPPTITP